MESKLRADKEKGKNYLSTLSARYNPDILLGDSFLKGNEYFTERALKANNQTGEKSENDDASSDEDLLDQKKK